MARQDTMSDYQVFLNDDFVPEDEARISVFDHGFLYGDGCFEGIRAYDGQVFKLEEHMDRLYDSAKAIALDPPYDKDELTDLVLEACRVNELEDAYIRPIFSRGVGDLGLDPRKCEEPTTVIIAREFPRLYGPELYEQGLEVATVSTRRNPPQCLSPNIKSMNYLNNIVGKIEANQLGVDEGLMLDVNGFVSEATADNFFIVEDGTVVTPPYYNSLQGITREAALEVADRQGFETEVKEITLFDVYSADEAFMTGTAAEVAPIVEVDGRQIGDGTPGEITGELVDAFQKYARNNGTPIYGDRVEA
jgi:branched-chain amino acid aminotransferase